VSVDDAKGGATSSDGVSRGASSRHGIGAGSGDAGVAVVGFGVFTPGYRNADAWLAGTPDEADALPTGEMIDKRSRRRASMLSRALADVYAESIAATSLDAEHVASVFGSALGEADTMIGLLDQMWREGGALSPMRFATSVHNAAAGVVSITAKNRGFTTSLGADYDTPAMALVEAICLAATRDEPVVVACGDEASPVNLVPDGEGWGLLAAAVALAPARTAPPNAMRIRSSHRAEPTIEPSSIDPRLAQNPVAGLLDLIEAVARGRHGLLRLDRGAGGGFCAELDRP
jgi:hypothetical protein